MLFISLNSLCSLSKNEQGDICIEKDRIEIYYPYRKKRTERKIYGFFFNNYET